MSEADRDESFQTGRPSVCRACGAIVGARQANCAVCGAPSHATFIAHAQQQQPQRGIDREAVRFARAIISRPAPFTFVFLIANIFVFILMSQNGGSESPGVLQAFGAKFNSLINAGEWWRFVTPVFLHIGVFHLIVNMYGLWILGPFVEKIYGSAKFVFFWIATGIAGVAASYFAAAQGMHGGLLARFLFRGGDGPSAGASGALFGLIGALFVFGIKFRHELPDGFRRAFGTGMLPTILINIFIGITVPFIDNAAHLGGLIAGALLALVVGYKRPGERAPVAYVWHILQFAALTLVVVSFAMVTQHFRDAPTMESAANPAQAESETNQIMAAAYIEAINGGRRAFIKAFNDADAPAAERAIESLNGAPTLDERSGALRDELKTLLARARDFARLTPAQRQARQSRTAREQLVRDFQSWQQRSDEWARTDGANFGIVLQEQSPAQESPAAPPPLSPTAETPQTSPAPAASTGARPPR